MNAQILDILIELILAKFPIILLFYSNTQISSLHLLIRKINLNQFSLIFTLTLLFKYLCHMIQFFYISILFSIVDLKHHVSMLMHFFIASYETNLSPLFIFN